MFIAQRDIAATTKKEITKIKILVDGGMEAKRQLTLKDEYVGKLRQFRPIVVRENNGLRPFSQYYSPKLKYLPFVYCHIKLKLVGGCVAPETAFIARCC